MDFDSTYRIVTPEDARRAEVDDLSRFAFAEGVAPGDEAASAALVPWRRTRVVEERATGRYRGVYSAFEMPTIVPGGARVPNLGLTIVGVHAGHRRRGLLTRMIRDHFEVARAEGAVMSTLWAAETGIYGRFGYGMVSEVLALTLSRGVELATVPGADGLAVEIETLHEATHAPIVAAIADGMARPGSARMDDEVLRWRTADKPFTRGVKEPQRIVIVRDGDVPVATAVFQRTSDYQGNVPSDVVNVGFHGALTPAAHRRLWSVLTDIDLSATVEVENLTYDHPLLRLVGPHRGVVKHVYDGIWARLLDVRACLEARSYDADASVTFALTDTVLPDNAGVWRLTTAADGDGTLERLDIAESEADLDLTIQQLSSSYLGGVTLASLHEAGQIQERRPGAVAELSRAIQGSVMPAGNFHF